MSVIDFPRRVKQDNSAAFVIYRSPVEMKMLVTTPALEEKFRTEYPYVKDYIREEYFSSAVEISIK